LLYHTVSGQGRSVWHFSSALVGRRHHHLNARSPPLMLVFRREGMTSVTFRHSVTGIGEGHRALSQVSGGFLLEGVGERFWVAYGGGVILVLSCGLLGKTRNYRIPRRTCPPPRAGCVASTLGTIVECPRRLSFPQCFSLRMNTGR